MSGFFDWLKSTFSTGSQGVENPGEFGYTPKAGATQSPVDFRVGKEKLGWAAALKGAGSMIDGMQEEELARQAYNRELAFKNAAMQQAYQNNLPAMYKLRRDSRVSANALAALGGL